ADFVNGTLTVTKAHLTVIALPQSRTYGAANPPPTVALSGYVNGDTAAVVSGSAVLNTAGPSSPVGQYAILVVNAGTLSAANYDFPAVDFVSSTLTITQAHLTVTAESKTRLYQKANPVLTVTLSGFENGETAAVVGGSPTLRTIAGRRSRPGR